MATESTAIHDLLSGFGRKAIPDDPDDDILFAGSRRRDGEADPKQPSQHPRAGLFTMPPPPVVEEHGSPYARAAGVPAAPARVASGTQPPPYSHAVIPTAPGARLSVPLPQAFVRHPAHAIQEAHGTVRVSKSSSWRIASAGVNKKLYAIPVGLFVIAVALAGVLLTGSDKPAAKVAASVEPAVEAPAAAAAEPAAAEPAAAAEPVAAAAVPAEPVAAEPAAAAEPVTAAAPVEPVAPVAPPPPRDMISPPTVVPESTFTAKYEPTVPTVTATPIEAPKVAVVAAAPAKAMPPAKNVKKSKRELARERRAARTAKRMKPRVAAVDKPAKAAKVEKAGAEDLNGNGALAISSASPREVWVDGKNSKRMTPLRVLVKPGKHTVTLFDKDHGTAKTFQVEVKPNTTTKISK